MQNSMRWMCRLMLLSACGGGISGSISEEGQAARMLCGGSTYMSATGDATVTASGDIYSCQTGHCSPPADLLQQCQNGAIALAAASQATTAALAACNKSGHDQCAAFTCVSTTGASCSASCPFPGCSAAHAEGSCTLSPLQADPTNPGYSVIVCSCTQTGVADSVTWQAKCSGSSLSLPAPMPAPAS